MRNLSSSSFSEDKIKIIDNIGTRVGQVGVPGFYGGTKKKKRNVYSKYSATAQNVIFTYAGKGTRDLKGNKNLST